MDMYVRLSYDEYKEVERQMKELKETAHTSVDGYYHKSIRLKVGELTFEFHGPIVKAAEVEYPEAWKSPKVLDAG